MAKYILKLVGVRGVIGTGHNACFQSYLIVHGFLLEHVISPFKGRGCNCGNEKNTDKQLVSWLRGTEQSSQFSRGQSVRFYSLGLHTI